MHRHHVYFIHMLVIEIVLRLRILSTFLIKLCNYLAISAILISKIPRDINILWQIQLVCSSLILLRFSSLSGFFFGFLLLSTVGVNYFICHFYKCDIVSSHILWTWAHFSLNLWMLIYRSGSNIAVHCSIALDSEVPAVPCWEDIQISTGKLTQMISRKKP